MGHPIVCNLNIFVFPETETSQLINSGYYLIVLSRATKHSCVGSRASGGRQSKAMSVLYLTLKHAQGNPPVSQTRQEGKGWCQSRQDFLGGEISICKAALLPLVYPRAKIWICAKKHVLPLTLDRQVWCPPGLQQVLFQSANTQAYFNILSLA